MPEVVDNIFSVSSLNAHCRLLLETEFPSVYVSGEISNLALPSSGHIYFSLKDAKAQIRCAMFRTNNSRLLFNPENGLQVIVKARVSLYEGRGDFQLIVTHMEASGDGLLRQAFEQLKNKLNQEGLFAATHKQIIPNIPKCIGVISSATGAAIQDVLSTLKRRASSIPVIIYPTEVQGKSAANTIAKAIEVANQRQECEVIILTRGGGSLEDLWCFNEEIVARAIYASKIPIVSGVGHEIDYTIADFVADVRAETPTAAAAIVSPDSQHLLALLEKSRQQILRLVSQIIQHKKLILDQLGKRLRHPQSLLRENMQRIDQLEQRIIRAMRNRLEVTQQRLVYLSKQLQTLSPLTTLERGYAIVLDEQHSVCTLEEISVGQAIEIQMHQGSLSCTVNKLNKVQQ